MSAIAAEVTELLTQAREQFRRGGEALGGAALWLGIAGVGIWAAVGATDEFAVGVVTGSILALGALGLTLIYGVLKFGHFAHGDAMMLAAYLAFFALTGVVVGEQRDTDFLPWSLRDLPGASDRIPWLGPGGGDFSFGYGLLIALVIVAFGMAGLFVLLERVVYRPLRRRGSGIVIFSIASLGIALAMRSTILIFWFPTDRTYAPGIRPTTELPFDVRIVTDQIFIFAAALVLAALVYLLLFRTKLGKAMRAMADNPSLAQVSGINTEQITNWTWAIAGGLVAVAGVLLALQTKLSQNLGFVLLLPLFAAAILGGIGSPQGALLGGMIVGITQEVSVSLDFLSPGYKFSVAFVILILILLLRPQGLFGTRT